jgi:hypothetical protein
MLAMINPFVQEEHNESVNALAALNDIALKKINLN